MPSSWARMTSHVTSRKPPMTMHVKWIALDKEGDHYKLAYDSASTWSQKYNLVWDQLLGYNLFPPSVRESESCFL